MLHIIGLSISPLDHAHGGDVWRQRLGNILSEQASRFWGTNREETFCLFPDEPKMSTDPYPTAVLLMHARDWTKYPRERWLDFTKLLAESCRDCLNDMRRTTDARAEAILNPDMPDVSIRHITT